MQTNLAQIYLIIGLLAAGELQAALFQQSSVTTTTTTTTTTTAIRLRANKLRRPELCRENLPRKSKDLPALVVTGKVKEVYSANSTTNQAATDASSSSHKALVSIGRVIKGKQELLGSDIIVSGFNASSSSPCPNYVKPNDTLILLLNHDSDRRYSIQGNNILGMNLNNLDRINAIASDEQYKRRGPIEDILCEAHYCPYGRCVVLQEKSAGQVTCQCPETCPSNDMFVCGSDNTTYLNECHLIKEGCKLKRPLFVTKETSC